MQSLPNHTRRDLRLIVRSRGWVVTVAMLFANVIAGLVWDRFGANATFLVGAVFAAVALLIAAQLKAAAEIF